MQQVNRRPKSTVPINCHRRELSYVKSKARNSNAFSFTRLQITTMTSSSNRDSFSLSLLVLTSALGGVALSSIYNQWKQRKKDPEKCHEVGHGLVWGSIGGAMNASMIYVGDRLKLYSYLRDACAKPGSFVTAIELAETTVRAKP